MKIYYEDYRLIVVEHEDGRYDIYDNKYGGKITHKGVSKEHADERIQLILGIRNRRENRRKNLPTWQIIRGQMVDKLLFYFPYNK